MLATVERVQSPRSAPGPRARPRSRWHSMVLAVLSVFMVASTGLVVAAPPAAAMPMLVAPLAAAAVRAAPSVVKAIAPAAGKKALSPLSAKLSAGLALFVGGLGANWPEGGGGIRMPWDVKVDAADPGDSPEQQPTVGSDAKATVTKVIWTTFDYGGVEMQTVRLEGTCSSSHSFLCPAQPTDAWSVGGVKVRNRCFDTELQDWFEQDFTLLLNARQRNIDTPPCVRRSDDGGEKQFPYASSEIINPNGGWVTYEATNPEKYVNPEFDISKVIGAEPKITGKAECVDPATGATSTVTRVSDGLDALPDVACPEGLTPKSVSWTSTVGDKVKDLGGVEYDFGEFPECSDMSCVLRVKVDGQACRVGIEACYDWQRVEPRSRVECEYGPYAVGLEQCRDLERIYRTTPGVTPEDPGREFMPQPAPGAIPQGQPGTIMVPANPEGQPIPEYIPGTPYRPDPHPVGDPPGNPGTTVVAPPVGDPKPPEQPGPTTVTVPPPVTNPPVDVPDVEAPTKNCIAGMASWNPVDWVYVPVKCALTWAFVPKPEAAGALTATATGIITGVGLGDWLDVPMALVSTVPEGSGCRGPALAMPAQLGGKTYYPLDACGPPMSEAARMSHAFISFAVVVLGGYAALNGLAQALTGYRLIERESKGTDT